jgi:hypothetical protein
MLTAHLMQSDTAQAVAYPGVQAQAKPANPAKSPKRPRGRPVGVKASGLRERAWRTIRSFKKTADHQPAFTMGDVLDIVATGCEKAAPCNLLKYLHQLERHGIITRQTARDPRPALTSRGAVIWRLTIDLGWDAPVWHKSAKVLWNPNTKTAIAMVAAIPRGQA